METEEIDLLTSALSARNREAIKRKVDLEADIDWCRTPEIRELRPESKKSSFSFRRLLSEIRL